MSPPPRILVATDSASDADLVRRLLRDEFSAVQASTDPARAVLDFETHRPEVLVLAFDSLEKAERYYLGLYRLGSVVHTLAHRTVVLCRQADVARVYTLCKQQYFHDYVLFWPVPHDALRLPMAVHHALRQVGTPHTAPLPPPAAEPAAAPRGLVLVVDDDGLQHTLMRTMLAGTGLDLGFASSGAEAMDSVARRRPDLILMDVDLPQVNGVEMTRRIKALEHGATLPIVMITGHGDKDVVVQSMKAGAAGFLVKPFGRDLLLAQLRACLPALLD